MPAAHFKAEIVIQTLMIERVCYALFFSATEYHSRGAALSSGVQSLGAHGGMSAQPRLLCSCQHRRLSQPHDKLQGATQTL